MIYYNEYELLELFESEPTIIGEAEVCIFKYAKIDKYDFTFTMSLYVFEETCILSLFHKDLKYPIFDISFDKIENIKCKDDKLIIQQRDNTKNIVVYFKPNYTFAFEDRLV
jgi:hypothetical protein